MSYIDDWHENPCTICRASPGTSCPHDEPMSESDRRSNINVAKLRHIRSIVAGWGTGYLPELAALDHAISVLEQR